MLDTLQKLEKPDKQQVKEKLNGLKERLSVLQHEIKQAGVPVVVLFEGWSASGKGEILREVILTLDPRNFSAKSTLQPSEEEKRMPFLWRHWNSIPQAGLFAMYDRSWYPEIYAALMDKKETSAKEKIQAVNIYERQLADAGYQIFKFFLHIDKKEQKKRMDALLDSHATAWRVDKGDQRQNDNYGKAQKAFDTMLDETNTLGAPWHVIDAKYRKAVQLEVFTILVAGLEAALANKAKAKKSPAKKPKLEAGPFSLRAMPALKEIVLSQQVQEQDYLIQLKELQESLRELHNEVYRAKIPVVLAFEGWDAAGKGGTIRRVVSALDPRGYDVVPVASPLPPEKNRQYLWRFWQNLQHDGHFTIFDRSWYGRVMVERVENFATGPEWQRAYREINEFEEQLTQWGAVVLKFWLQIDKDEQLRRFEDRQNTPEKNWKITDEDWRNREKWDEYEIVVNDMLRLTSTTNAPWHIVPTQSKQFGRIRTLQIIQEALQQKLGK